MRAISSVLLILSLGFGGSALAADEAQLVEAINAYRGQVQRCGALASPELPPLASDPRGPAWLQQSIDAARDLIAQVILVAFFGKGSLLEEDGQLKKADVDVVVERVKAAAPRAQYRYPTPWTRPVMLTLIERIMGTW